MKRPWNVAALPVYSLATYLQAEVNMNICTYITAISMQPKLYAIAVYNNTRTLHNLEKSNVAVLQFLHPSQFGLVKILGKKSGFEIYKHQYLNNKNLLTTWKGMDVLKNVSALVQLKKLHSRQTGDHKLFVFEVTKYKSYHDELLTTTILRDKKIISA